MRTLGRSRENVDFTLISCPEFLCLFVPSLTSGNVGPGQESTQPKIRASHLDVGVVEASDGCGGPDAVSGRAANDESLPGLQNIAALISLGPDSGDGGGAAEGPIWKSGSIRPSVWVLVRQASPRRSGYRQEDSPPRPRAPKIRTAGGDRILGDSGPLPGDVGGRGMALSGKRAP